MNDMEKINESADWFAGFVSKLIFILVRVIPPLIVGRFLGIIAERIVYCVIIAALSRNFVNAVDILLELAEENERLK